MLVSDLDFDLPPRLIAQRPASPRDAARLLHARCADLDRGADAAQAAQDRHVSDLPEILRSGDLLIVNDSRVLRARLRGSKAGSGGRVEALLLREVGRNLWECLLRPSARLKPGTRLHFALPDSEGATPATSGAASGAAPLIAEPTERQGENWIVRFLPPDSDLAYAGASPGGFDVRQVLGEYGEVPLPPYIRAGAPEADYQTVYARAASASLDDVGPREEGALDSCAAPTAGLHFTPRLIESLRERGIEMASVTLGVGPGTFRPVQSETLEGHAMHQEEFFIPASTAARIAEQKRRGGRVVAIGTTSARALESAACEGGVRSGLSSTRLFVRPGYEFQVVDALMTNFHLPRSTLLALVAAWAQCRALRDGVTLDGLAQVHALYQHAIAHDYRFFSFGDAMLLD